MRISADVQRGPTQVLLVEDLLRLDQLRVKFWERHFGRHDGMLNVEQAVVLVGAEGVHALVVVRGDEGALLEEAVVYYRHQLTSTPAGQQALAYLQGRGLDDATLEAAAAKLRAV